MKPDKVSDQVPALIGLAFLAGLTAGAQLAPRSHVVYVPAPSPAPRPALPAPIAPPKPDPWKICKCGAPVYSPEDWSAHWLKFHQADDPLAEVFSPHPWESFK